MPRPLKNEQPQQAADDPVDAVEPVVDAAPDAGDLKPADAPEPAVAAASVETEKDRRIRELEKELAAQAHRAALAVPPCPPMGPEGDKTEAVMRWLAKHKPEEFRAKYAHRGGTLVTELLATLPK